MNHTSKYHFNFDARQICVNWSQLLETDDVRIPQVSKKFASHPNATLFMVTLSSNAFDGIDDVLLRVHYLGDAAQAWLDGNLMADNFYNGMPWEIGLKRFMPEVLEKGFVICMVPMCEENQIYLENWVLKPSPDVARIEKIDVICEREVMVVQAAANMEYSSKKACRWS